MPSHNPNYIAVDELLPQVGLEQAAAFYGETLPELRRVGSETRMACFLNCGKAQPTGDRAVAIQHDHPAKQWKCHQYGCGKSGNLVSLCDLLKPGPNQGGRPRGARFKEIAADLRAMAEGVLGTPRAPAPPQAAVTAESPPKRNAPLRESDNERARGLVNLDEKFVRDEAALPPAVSAYFRRRPFVTPEVCRKWRMGYLPRNAGDDKSGGTMRGLVVYPLLDEAGEVLTWFGRDPEFTEKHARWVAAGRPEREPQKFHFVKGFHRGLELFGQHGGQRLREPGFRESIAELGLIVVEGPNDVIRLDTLGVPAVGLCSNTISQGQVEKIARWATDLADGKVTLLLDCDAEGENGARQAIYELAAHCRVRLGWSPAMHGGKFQGRQPESLTHEEWHVLRDFLVRVNVDRGLPLDSR